MDHPCRGESMAGLVGLAVELGIEVAKPVAHDLFDFANIVGGVDVGSGAFPVSAEQAATQADAIGSAESSEMNWRRDVARVVGAAGSNISRLVVPVSTRGRRLTGCC